MSRLLSAAEVLGRYSVVAAERKRALIWRLILALLGIWSGSNVYRGQSVAAAAAASAVAVAAAQGQARLLAQASMLAYLTLAGARDVPRIPPGVAYPRGGANIFDVWNRPAETARFRESLAVSAGAVSGDWAERVASEGRRAVAEGRKQIRDGGDLDVRVDDAVVDAMFQQIVGMAGQEVSLAYRDENRRVMRATGTTVYRRVPHPERSRGGTCGLCFVAATQVYKAEHLLPLHDRCECEQVPIVGGRDGIGTDGDPGLYLNKTDLRAFLDAMYAGRGPDRDGNDRFSYEPGDLKRVNALEVIHSETGPRLTSGSRMPSWAVADDVSVDDDSTPMWRAVLDIADARTGMGGSDAELSSFGALADTASAMLSGKGV